MKKILVLYGGVSPEHEVSIITALQAMDALQNAGYSVTPVYISKSGEWLLGNESFFKPESYKDHQRLNRSAKNIIPPVSPNRSFLIKSSFGYKNYDLQIDAIFPIFHGRNGEDGSIQGLIQLLNLPQLGCQLTSSSVGLDKNICKRIASELGMHTNPDVLITKSEWQINKENVLKNIKHLGNDIFLKPNSLGSSIGIKRITDQNQLSDAIDVAFAYDQRVLIEKTLSDALEVNISILGNGPYQTSITEQPIGTNELLSFQDKYLSSESTKSAQGMASAKRLMPAPISKNNIIRLENFAQQFFKAIDGKGLARIDFMLKDKDIYFNEINTIPGSLCFYLWEKSDINFPQLMDKLVQLAHEDWQQRQKLVTTFDSNILSHYNPNASKGVKSKTGN